MLKKFIVNKDYHNSRFDRWFKHNINQVPQSFIEKLARKKKVKVNNKKIKTSYRVQFNDLVEVHGVENLKTRIQSKKNKYQASKKEQKNQLKVKLSKALKGYKDNGKREKYCWHQYGY